MTKQLEGQVALVTGGSSGIGRATALAFANEGARVVVSDLDVAGGELSVAELRASGANAEFARADISREEDVSRLIDGIVRKHGRLDVAFNNAGIAGTQASVAELSEAEWAQVIGVNLTGVFLCMKYELLQMAKQGAGSIINNASILGAVGFAGAAAYTASKHGVLGLTKVAAIEYATQGVRVNAVCPGFIVTPMLERAGLLSDPQVKAQIEGLHAMKRLGNPEEVAAAVVFLASRGASFVTGHPLLVDGGFVST